MQTEFQTAILNTLLICGCCIGMAVPTGLFLSFVLVRTNIRFRRAMFVALCSQLAVPLYVFAAGWSAAIGTQGWMRGWLPELFPAASSIGNFLSVAAIHALAAIPWVCIINALGLIWTDRNQEEVATIEGGYSQLLRRSLLPRMRYWIGASCLWCAIPVLTEMVVTNLYQVPSVAEQIYLDASRGSISPQTYLFAVLTCILPIIVAGWLLNLRAPPWRHVVNRAAHYSPHELNLTTWRLPLTLATLAIVVVLTVIPILSLIAKAGWKPYVDSLGQTSYGWSFRRFFTTAKESVFLFGEEFYWSSLLAFMSSIIAFAIASGLIAACISRNRTAIVAFSMLLLVAVPGPLAGMLVIDLMNRDSPQLLGLLYDTTLAAPILAQQFRLLPLAWTLLVTVRATIDQSTWEQIQIDGMSRWQALRLIILPHAATRLFVAWLLVFVYSLGELSCSILVLPPGVTTVSMRLFEMLHFGMRHQDSGLSGILLLYGWLVSLAIWKTLRDR
ncbi:MAG: iron ABC transporter permease [Planctomycetales bacterium]|nr:iron ABC transporter permease [Planctomycetales bacterium]